MTEHRTVSLDPTEPEQWEPASPPEGYIDVTTHSTPPGQQDFIPVASEPVSRTDARFSETGMRATLSIEVAVVSQREPRRRCETCGKRRVLFALTFTDALMGNPDHPWRCAPCWGLR